MNTQNLDSNTRYHDLDALRAGMMFLGLVIHASLSFVYPVVPPWPASDSDPSLFFTILCYFIHAFRMQIFFLIAGFFGAMMWRKRGPAGYLANRLKRVGLPFIASCLILVPLLQCLWVIGFQHVSQKHLDAVKVYLPRFDIEKYRVPVSEFFTSGTWLDYYMLYHLWFLQYLLVYIVLMFFVAPLGDKLFQGESPRKFLRVLFASRAKVVWLSLITLAFFWFMKGRAGVDTPTHFLPEPQILAYYGLFFILGWCLYSQAELIRKLGEYWKLYLAFGTFVLLPINLQLTVAIREITEKGTEVGEGIWWAYRVGFCVLTWAYVIGFLGLFQRYFSQPKAWIRYLADSSYWVYLLHLPVVVILQILVSPIDLPGPIKFIGVMLATGVVCVGTYHLFVRRTAIGVFLNGERKGS